MRGQLTVGELTVVISYLGAVYGPLSAIAHTTGQLQGALAGARRVRAMFALMPETVRRRAGRDRRDRRRRATSGSRTSASPIPTARSVLHDITFAAKPGRDDRARRADRRRQDDAGQPDPALLRRRPPAACSIDGVDVRHYRVRSLREKIAIVLQDPVLFSGHDRRQPALRPARRDRRGDRGGGARRARPRVHLAAAEGLRHARSPRPAAGCRAASASA